jgi:hypothetical protein
VTTYGIVRDAGVLLVTAVGEFRLADVMLMRAQVRQAWLERPTRAALYDFRFALFDMTPADWALLHAAASRWGLTECSSNAVVSAPAEFSAFMARGGRYAHLGVCYAIFTDYDLALRWAMEHPLPAKTGRVARK